MAAQPMFAPLSTDEREAAANAKPASQSIYTPIIPAPDDAPTCRFRHPAYGQPTGVWPWHDAVGKLVGYTMRFDYEKGGQPAKDVLPITYCENGTETGTTRGWRSCGAPTPRPLYRLTQLLASPQKAVILTEGEKKAERAVELFSDFVATTTMGGCKQPHLTDFAALAGRDVVVWPDNDDAGRGYAAQVAMLALAAGALRVAVVQVPGTFPAKWDLADERPADVSAADLRRFLDAAVDVEPPPGGAAVELPLGYAMTERGLVWRDPFTNDEEEGTEILVTGRFEVLAETRDGDGCSWGVLLHWVDHDGRDHDLALPRALLAGDGADARRLLIDGGLFVAPGRKARERLNAFLMSVRASGRARATNRVGVARRCLCFPERCVRFVEQREADPARRYRAGTHLQGQRQPRGLERAGGSLRRWK